MRNNMWILEATRELASYVKDLARQKSAIVKYILFVNLPICACGHLSKKLGTSPLGKIANLPHLSFGTTDMECERNHANA